MLGQGPLAQPNLAAIPSESGVVITPALFRAEALIHAPIMVRLDTRNIAPVHFAPPAVFFGQSVSMPNQIVPQTFITRDLVHTPLVSHELELSRFNDVALFFVPTVGVVGTQALAPGRFVSQDLFHVPLVDTVLKFVEAKHFADVALFFRPTIVRAAIEPEYTYPIGTGLESDYGIRSSMTFYKQRLVLGHRYGRRR
jgi:hypothetical protein